MTQSLNLYNAIAYSAKTGVDVLDELIKRSLNKDLSYYLLKVQSEYKNIAYTADEKIIELGGIPYEITNYSQFETWAAVKLITMLSPHLPKIAKWLLKGIEAPDKHMKEASARYFNATEQAKNMGASLLNLLTAQRSIYDKFIDENNIDISENSNQPAQT